MINSYKDLPIGKWQEILNIDINDDNREVKLIQILSNKSEDDILDLKLNEFKELYNQTSFLLEEPKKKLINDTYTLGNTEYEVVTNVDNLIVSQFIDYQTFIKDADKYLIELIGVFLIPKGYTYGKDYDIRDTHDNIREYLSVEDAVSLSSFFLTLSQSWLKVMEISLIKEVRKMQKKMQK